MDMLDKIDEILDKMDEIYYGFTDIKGRKYEASENNYGKYFPTLYRLKIKDELLEDKYGICWDQVELLRYYLKKENIDCQSYGIICYDGEMDPTHTFVVVSKSDKCYWVEHAWGKYKGIHMFDSIDDLLKDVKDKFSLLLGKDKVIGGKIYIYKYDEPLVNYDCMQFYDYMKKGELVKIDEEDCGVL